MAGVGKLLKQAQKMQRGIESLQAQLDAKEIEITSGGGAVRVKISGGGKFLALTLDPEFLKEDAKLVADTHSFTLSPKPLAGIASQGNVLACGDIDGDGIDDMAIAGAGVLQVFRGLPVLQ